MKRPKRVVSAIANRQSQPGFTFRVSVAAGIFAKTVKIGKKLSVGTIGNRSTTIRHILPATKVAPSGMVATV